MNLRMNFLRELPARATLAMRLALLGTSLTFPALAAPARASNDLTAIKHEVVRNYAAIAGAIYQDACHSATSLRVKVDDLLQHPSPTTLSAARAAWIKAREPFLQAEVFRFYEGPIDRLDGRINAWPVDETYIDYVKEDPVAGIINRPDLYPELSLQLIESLNEKEGEKSISSGFHAIEFLLWGQDLDPKGPGSRSYLDYVSDGPVAHVQRRRKYLLLVTDLLVSDLHALAEQWADHKPDNYRAWFIASPPHQSLRKILHGMGSLSATELAGERLTVPYETKEQEDEHSCFSDTTCGDVIFDTVGIRNVYAGYYVTGEGTRIEGPGIDRLLREVDPDLAAKLTEQIQASVEAARAIPSPFDQAVLGDDQAVGRKAIHHTISCLLRQSETIAKAAALLGVRDETE